MHSNSYFLALNSERVWSDLLEMQVTFLPLRLGRTFSLSSKRLPGETWVREESAGGVEVDMLLKFFGMCGDSFFFIVVSVAVHLI